MASSSTPLPSDFYCACRCGDIVRVKEYIQNMSLDDINKKESNGSTALHVACYYGHEDIVKLLLEYGALRSIINKHGLTAYEESKTKSIKQLFDRTVKSEDRFLDRTGKTDWISATSESHWASLTLHEKLRHAISKVDFRTRVQITLEYYINRDLKNIRGIDEIQLFFDKAIQEQTSLYILKAYTAETDFYSILNTGLAQTSYNNIIFNVASFNANKEQTNHNHSKYYALGSIVAIIAHSPEFRQYGYIGKTHRGMKITEDDLEQYVAGQNILTKSFLSTSKDIEVAKRFVLSGDLRQHSDGQLIKLPAICTYIIEHSDTAYDIETISEYPEEKEVLIVPYKAFAVSHVEKDTNNTTNEVMINIVLTECSPR
jgi:hypothetical protein